MERMGRVFSSLAHYYTRSPKAYAAFARQYARLLAREAACAAMSRETWESEQPMCAQVEGLVCGSCAAEKPEAQRTKPSLS